MKHRTVTVREGEWLGPIDWESPDWPFLLSDDEEKLLREVEAEPEAFMVTNDGGWPRVGWHDVIRVGMWDGWPYWQPGPAILVDGVLGPEVYWAHRFDARRKDAR